MTKKLILISHGIFCEELKKSTEMIMGPQEDIIAIPLLPEESKEDFIEKFKKATLNFDEFVVFTDLSGGTPCNAVMSLILEGKNIEIYAGMNMPMVIQFINDVLVGTESDYKKEGVEGIIKVNDLLNSFDDEDE